jgi:hypothetical protein
MASSINALTTGSGGVITTADNSGDLNIQSGGSTKIAVTSAGAAVTGTLTVNGTAVATAGGAVSGTTGTFTDEVTMPVLGVNTTAASTNMRFIVNGDNVYDAGMRITSGGTSIADIGSYAQFISGSATNLLIKGYGPSYTAVITSTGGVALNSGATSWSALSDERYKDIIEPITDGLTKVNSLRAVIGKYKTDEEDTRRSFLIAQDVQAVLPEAVTAYVEEEGKLSLSYTDVIPLLVAAIKELKAIVDTQAEQIKALRGVK